MNVGKKKKADGKSPFAAHTDRLESALPDRRCRSNKQSSRSSTKTDSLKRFIRTMR